jgi:fructokinase
MWIWVCGEALIDLIPDAPMSSNRNAIPGGGPANAAHALARLGIEVEFIGGLSRDKYGVRMRKEFVDDGVGLAFTPDFDQPTCLAIVSVDKAGGASYEFEIDGTATFAFDLANLPDAKKHLPAALYIGTLGTLVEPGASVLAAWVGEVRKSVPIVYDPNIRSVVMDDRDRYQENVSKWVGLATVVKVSSDDLAWLYPDVNHLEISREWLADNSDLELVVVTNGADGIAAINRDTQVNVPGVKVDVVDTVGAGDTVGAILLESILKYGVTGLNTQYLSHTLHRAALAAAITCSRAGANPPNKEELP